MENKEAIINNNASRKERNMEDEKNNKIVKEEHSKEKEKKIYNYLPENVKKIKQHILKKKEIKKMES